MVTITETEVRQAHQDRPVPQPAARRQKNVQGPDVNGTTSSFTSSCAPRMTGSLAATTRAACTRAKAYETPGASHPRAYVNAQWPEAGS